MDAIVLQIKENEGRPVRLEVEAHPARLSDAVTIRLPSPASRSGGDVLHGTMGRVVMVATAGAGGDLPPLIAAGLALRARGHELRFIGDGSVAGLLRSLEMEGKVLPPEVDLGP